MISKLCVEIFKKAIDDYHIENTINQAVQCNYKGDTLEYLLYLKCWIDTVQWHMEDIIRNPAIDSIKGLKLKRDIDRSNQERTNIVELIDDHFLRKFVGVVVNDNAKINTESVAWVIDRLSILTLKIFHMKEETLRTEATPKHRESCSTKLNILLEQSKDLSQSLDELWAPLFNVNMS